MRIARYGYGYGDNSSEKPAKAEQKATETSIDSALSATINGSGNGNGNGNGHGAMNNAHQVEMLLKHLEDIDWTYTGRHAKVGKPSAEQTEETEPTLFLPRNGDLRRE